MRRTALVAAALVAALAVSARAEDAASRLARAEAVAADEPDVAERLLSEVADDAAATADERVRGARIALRGLPFEAGNRAAAELVLATLRENRSQPDAWQLSFRIRDRVMDGLDLPNGTRFLRSLVEIYPDQMRFRHSLVDLYLKGGRPDGADRECMEIQRLDPADTRALYVQAILREREGRADEALALYARIHEIGGDLEPLVYRVRILIDPACDYAAAEEALVEALAAVEAAPPGRARNAVRADLEYERERLETERTRRADLLRTAARLDRVVVAIGAGWIVALGGGLLLLRRRGLV